MFSDCIWWGFLFCVWLLEAAAHFGSTCAPCRGRQCCGQQAASHEDMRDAGFTLLPSRPRPSSPMAPGHPLQLRGGSKPFLTNEAKLVFGSSVRLLSVNWGTSLLIGTNVVTGRNVCSTSNATGAELIGFMGTLPEHAMELGGVTVKCKRLPLTRHGF